MKAPEPLRRRWTEPLNAHNFGHVCVPMGRKNLATPWIYSEDCLYLNVYVPAGGASRKTVLVYIHGGGFISGDSRNSTYGADFLLSQDNIVVKIQYRLGIFGFLNFGNDEYTGNMGLKDQQMALKWVYENIENFSGNKNEILLFGQSAGKREQNSSPLVARSNVLTFSLRWCIGSLSHAKSGITQIFSTCIR